MRVQRAEPRCGRFILSAKATPGTGGGSVSGVWREFGWDFPLTSKQAQARATMPIVTGRLVDSKTTRMHASRWAESSGGVTLTRGWKVDRSNMRRSHNVDLSCLRTIPGVSILKAVSMLSGAKRWPLSESICKCWLDPRIITGPEPTLRQKRLRVLEHTFLLCKSIIECSGALCLTIKLIAGSDDVANKLSIVNADIVRPRGQTGREGRCDG